MTKAERVILIRRELAKKSKDGEDNPLNGDSKTEIPETIFLCPLCRKGYLIEIMTLPRRWRAPP